MWLIWNAGWHSVFSRRRLSLYGGNSLSVGETASATVCVTLNKLQTFLSVHREYSNFDQCNDFDNNGLKKMNSSFFILNMNWDGLLKNVKIVWSYLAIKRRLWYIICLNISLMNVEQFQLICKSGLMRNTNDHFSCNCYTCKVYIWKKNTIDTQIHNKYNIELEEYLQAYHFNNQTNMKYLGLKRWTIGNMNERHGQP